MANVEAASTAPPSITSMSAIGKFFKYRSVLITGATGFIGKVIIEKILRDCSEVETVYILVRPKGEKDANFRKTEIMDTFLFKEVNPQKFSKVVAIEGDLELPNLGLTVENQQKLCEEVSLVIHAAAATGYNENLNTAFEVNVNGTKRIVELCRKIRNLAALVYVSTMFANCDQSTIDEIIYPVQGVKAMENRISEYGTEEILGKKPNMYLYSKAMAETFLEAHSGELPICIVRSTTVGPTWRDPTPGWIDSFGNLSTLISLWGSSNIRSIRVDMDKHLDVMPVDLVVNLILAASWKTAESSSKSKLEVYNSCSSIENPLFWETMRIICNKYLVEIPFEGAVLPPHLAFRSNGASNWMYNFLYHWIPAVVMDTCASFTSKKGRGLEIYHQVKKFQNSLKWFSTSDWTFDTTNTQKLFSQMSAQDQAIFNFEIKDLDWKNYFEDYCAGLRDFLLKQDESTIPIVRRKTKTMSLINKGSWATVSILIVAGLLYLIYYVTRVYTFPIKE